MTIATILSEKPIQGAVSIHETATLGDLVAMLAERGIGAVIVIDEAGALIGVISERDIIRALGAFGADALAAPVAAHMTRAVQTASLEDSPLDLLERMTEGRFRHMPVVADGAVLGMLSIGDLVKHRIEVLLREKEAMEEFIRS